MGKPKPPGSRTQPTAISGNTGGPAGPAPADAKAPADALQLSAEHSLLRTLIDIGPDMIFVRDRSHRHLLNNRAQLAILGRRTMEETLGKTDADFYPPDIAAAFRAESEAVMESGRALVNAETRLPGPDGSPIWLSTTKVPLRGADGRVVGLVGVARDVTAQKIATERLAEQAAMLDQAHDAIVLLDLEGRVIYWNQAAAQLYGWTAQEAMGKTHRDLLPGADLPAMSAAMQETLERGSWHGEIQLHHKGGKELSIDGRRSLIRDADGSPRAILSIGIDITDKKKRDLQTVRTQRLESIGTLAGGIAHDLNNVLAPILMSIELLKAKVSDPNVHRLLGVLEANAERGAQLVRQVLAFGRGAQGDRIIVQPLHIAREVAQIIRDTFPKAIRFELMAKRDLWTVTGDPTQIHQVLLNLCVNARDAMESGGRLSLQLENIVVDETYAGMNSGAKAGPHVMIAISDTGSGIAPEIREHIFEPFFTTKEVGKGTGLGLSTSLGIVQGHGGFINLTSEPGKGSSFRIYLPANPDDSVLPQGSARRAGLPRGNNEVILVVDDEEPILKVAKSTLEAFGYRVLLARNGAEAVSLYALHRSLIAAVLTDMAMPVMDGNALAVALISMNPAVRIIASSGQGSNASVSAAKSSGVRAFIPKPYTAEALLKTLASVLKAPRPKAPAARKAKGAKPAARHRR